MLDKSKKFIIYKVDNCSYCAKAIDLIDATGAPYEIRHAQRHSVHMEFLRSLSIQPKLTFPQIFYGDTTTRIGGCDDLEEYLAKKILFKYSHDV